jgi:hypothetical protein
MQSRRQREDTGIAQGAKFTALAGLDRIVKLADSRCQSGRTLAQRFPQANPARYLIAGTSSGRSFGPEAHSLRGAQGKLDRTRENPATVRVQQLALRTRRNSLTGAVEKCESHTSAAWRQAWS